MAIKRVPISTFIKELEAALNRKDGYIMGAYGQNPRTGSLDLNETRVMSSWKTSGYYYTQYNSGYSANQKKKALYWREHATRVWDCNGLAEGIYQMYTGTNINARARNNYASWCDPKSSDMSKMPKEPGVAVFKYSSSAGAITHVGYLWKPVNASKPNGDWYVIEAKGVLYGVVSTKYSNGGWNRWGKMTKYYDYTDNTIIDPIPEGPIEILGLKKGSSGSSVRELQNLLMKAGYNLPRYGADGDFGTETDTAVRTLQIKNNLLATGIIDEATKALLVKEEEKVEPATSGKQVRIVGGNCYVRLGPGVGNEAIGVAKRGETYPYLGAGANGWNKIQYKDIEAYVSGKYSSVI